MVNARLLLLDWGDTVMVDFPEYSGPMSEWPRVEAVPAAANALAELAARFTLVLASSAEESGPQEARQALDRVGLGDYFQHIFTARILGKGKADPAFYLNILKKLDVPPEQAIMIGDSYPGDILSASQAGLKTVWLNPGGAPCPQTHPQHEAEIRSIAELLLVLEQVELPSLSECFQFLHQESAPPNLVEHCLGVGACAYWTAVWLEETGVEVDPLLAHRGGILHDLDKITNREQGQPHGQWSGILLRQKGYPKLAKIAERHVITKIMDPKGRPATWEEKLVFYTDKLVENSKFVGLEIRMAALEKRYPQFASLMKASGPLLQAMEDEILAILGLSQEEYYHKLAALNFQNYAK